MRIIARILRRITRRLDNPRHKTTGPSPELRDRHRRGAAQRPGRQQAVQPSRWAESQIRHVALRRPARSPCLAVYVSPDWLRAIGSLVNPAGSAQCIDHPTVGTISADEDERLVPSLASPTRTETIDATGAGRPCRADSRERTLALRKIAISVTPKLAVPAAQDLGGALPRTDTPRWHVTGSSCPPAGRRRSA
jgi:hypothetical protein